jgi:hypothetical protein
MTKSAILSAVFASYVAAIFAVASIPDEAPPEVREVAQIQTTN